MNASASSETGDFLLIISNAEEEGVVVVVVVAGDGSNVTFGGVV